MFISRMIAAYTNLDAAFNKLDSKKIRLKKRIKNKH